MSNLNSVLDKAKADAKFRERLKADPAAALKEAGVELPAGKTVEVIEEGRDELHIFLGQRGTAPELERILERADKDAAFKRRLLADSKAVLEETLGGKLPAGARVHVHEKTPNHSFILLPAPPAAEGELSELELEAVAGGGLIARIRDAVCIDRPTGNTQDGSYSPSPGIHITATESEYSRTRRDGAGTYYE